MDNLQLQKPRDFGDLITDTFTYLRIHFKTLGLGLVYFVLPVTLLGSILMGSGFYYISDMTADPASANAMDSFSFFFRFFGGTLLVMLSSSVLLAVTYTHMRYTLQEISVDGPGMLAANIIPKTFGVLALTIINGFLSFLAALLFIFPGIYVAIKLYLSPAAFLIQNQTIGGAINRSWELVKDYWWLTFGFAIVIGIIAYIASSVLSLPIFIIGMLSGLLGGSGDSAGILGAGIAVFYSLSMIFSILFSVIPAVANGLHLLNLTERKEGSGLRSRIDELEL